MKVIDLGNSAVAIEPEQGDKIADRSQLKSRINRLEANNISKKLIDAYMNYVTLEPMSLPVSKKKQI